MPHLYVNRKGFPHRKHSYSAGSTYDQSPLKYFLQKIEGWREPDNRGTFLFGRAIEEAIQYFHDHNGQNIVEDFQARWNQHKDNTKATYTKTEQSWENLYHVGTEMMKLYQIRQPSLPIPLGGGVSFQREFAKEVFPGDPNYGEIEDCGKLDIIAYVNPDHPMLPRLEWKPEYGVTRPLIVDIKTSAIDFLEQQGIAAFDKQLRRYSWLSGIRDVSLLWFVKKNRSIQKGSSVTLLVDLGEFKAGEEAVVAKVEKLTNLITDPSDVRTGVWLVRNDFMLDEMDKAQGKKADGKTDQTNAAKQKAFEWLQQNGTPVDEHEITKQRLQFNCGFVTIESANEAGAIAARQIVQIVNSWKTYGTKPWPSEFGVRFPHDDRNDPFFRAFVLKDEGFRRDYFTRSEETIDDLFAEEPEVE